MEIAPIFHHVLSQLFSEIPNVETVDYDWMLRKRFNWIQLFFSINYTISAKQKLIANSENHNSCFGLLKSEVEQQQRLFTVLMGRKWCFYSVFFPLTLTLSCTTTKYDGAVVLLVSFLWAFLLPSMSKRSSKSRFVATYDLVGTSTPFVNIFVLNGDCR